MRVSLGIVGAMSVLNLANAGSAKDTFTIQDLVSAPRPGGTVASPDGTLAVSTVDTWNQKEDKMYRKVYLVSLNSTSTAEPVTLFTSIPKEAGSFLWLDSETLAYLNGSTLRSLPVDYSTQGKEGSVESKEILTFPDGVNPSNLQYEPSSGSLIFSGQVWGDKDFEGTPKGDKAWDERGNSGVVYDDLFIRHWDSWRTPGKVWTIGLTRLSKGKDGYAPTSSSKPDFINLLAPSGLEQQADPHGSISVHEGFIAFSVKPPYLAVSRHTRQDVYVLPIPTDSVTTADPVQLTPNDHGAIDSVEISPDGKKVAWVEMKQDGYESDKRVLVVHELASRGAGKSVRWTDSWDRSPTEVKWTPDSKSLYLVAENEGKVLPYYIAEAGQTPTELYFEGSSGITAVLSDHELLLSINTLVSPSDSFVLKVPEPGVLAETARQTVKDRLRPVTSWSTSHIAGRLDDIKGEELWFKGANGWDVMAWVLKPHGWNESDASKKAKWPLAFLVHGGPQGAWNDGWSTRWNPAVFAAQGYFVVAVNPTGSTGYGQEFCDKIVADWGGAPYKDLLAGYKAALDKYPQIDPERTAMLGASYGGYMANWIQGHNEPFGFKAIVCHDGVFNTESLFYETEELWFPTREFRGDPTTQGALYDKWNPEKHVSEWSVPQLVIQGGHDFRIPDGQSFGAFTALQVQGVPSRLLYFPDESHWVLAPHNSVKWHQEVFKWIDQWTQTGKKDDVEGVSVPAQTENEDELVRLRIQ